MKAWTRYPFRVLGDKENETPPWRLVTVLCWDGDKYATVEFEGKKYEMKIGYLQWRKNPSLYFASRIQRSAVPVLPWDAHPDRTCI